MTSKCSDWRDGPPGPIAGVACRPPQSLRFVDDEQIDSRFHGLIAQLRTIDQHIDRNNYTAMHVEWIEVGTKVACDVGEARGVEQGEHLVVLSPELAQPLHRQSLWHDNEAAIDRPRVHEPVQNQRGLDGFAEADFVGEQPAHRIARARALGDVQLVREEANASAEERAQAIGFAKRQEMQDVQTDQEILEVIDIAQREPLEKRAFEFERPQRMSRGRASVG